MSDLNWDDQAAGDGEPDRLVYRSRLLGADPRVTNYGGGNTSAKVRTNDPLTNAPTTVLWVKGSGGDLGSIDRSGFATVYQDRVVGLEQHYRGLEHEDEMVGLLPHCVFDLNPRAPSIDTPLHAFVPFDHVDHVHPDAVIALAAARNGERLTAEIYGGEVGWVPWQRPGFDLGLRLRETIDARPGLRGIVMGGHGLIAWADDAKSCYENTLELIGRAEAWIARNSDAAPFGGSVGPSLEEDDRRALAARVMPLLRGRVSGDGHRVGHFDDHADVLQFTTSAHFEELARLGTSCPDHFLRTKIRPLVLPPGLEAIEADLDELLAAYREDYQAYYERWAEADSPPIRGRDPVVFLIPGAGMITFAADKATARIAAEFYLNAIRVMRGATALDEYVPLHEREAFRIEYWALEQAKLDRRPPPRPMQGRVAVVTGGGGGIGHAVARRLLADGCCVLVEDVDEEALDATVTDLRERFGPDVVRSALANVTSETDIEAAYETVAREFGGVDIVVSCAGLASAAPITETSLELWTRNQDVLSTGYFLVARGAMTLLRRQDTGGSIVFIGSKNGVAASPGASAYCTAKAAELHLARCLALEGAEHGIRVNTVNPDAVLAESQIWTGTWREERAAAYGIRPDELEEHYRKRSLLKLSVEPEHVAEAVHYFASDHSSRSTGNMLNVDGGNAAAFPR